MSEIFHLDFIQEVLETAMWSAAIREAVPTSIIIVSLSGTAKSKILLQYDGPSIIVTDGITSAGMWQMVETDRENKLKFILIPDLNPTLSRRWPVVQSTIANLLSLTADGTIRMDDGRDNKRNPHEPVGLITACTPEIYESQARKWFALGLRRRIIPVFFNYTNATTKDLQKSVRDGKISNLPLIKRHVALPVKRVIPEMPPSFAMDIENQSLIMSQNLGKFKIDLHEKVRWGLQKVMPISPQVTLTNLARAHARMNDRATVAVEDMEFIIKFVGCTDQESPYQI